VSQLPALMNLWAQNNMLTSIDVSNNPQLMLLNVWDNYFTSENDIKGLEIVRGNFIHLEKKGTRVEHFELGPQKNEQNQDPEYYF
jgi:hypothetical protein